MDNKSYAKCRLCEYKGGCAFNHNGDQELCDLNITHLDLTDHDKQVRDEVIDEFRKYYMKRYKEEKKMGLIFDFTLDILKEFEQMEEE